MAMPVTMLHPTPNRKAITMMRMKGRRTRRRENAPRLGIGGRGKVALKRMICHLAVF